MTEEQPSRPVRVWGGIAILAPIAGIFRDARDVLSRPLAFFGGVFGSTVLSAGLASAFLFCPVTEAPAEDEFQLDIQPGTLVRLGEKLEVKELPEKIIVEEKRVEEAVQKETVTKKEIPPEKPPEEKKKEVEPKKVKPKKSKKKKGKVADSESKKKNDFDDLPTVDNLPGDPFGDPGGWSDLRRAGDPWATGIMRALNGMAIPAWAARASAGNFRFKLKVCRDGRIAQVIIKGRSGDDDLDDAIQAELQRTRLPKAPANISKLMQGDCTTLKYTFVWSADGRVN